jgi:sec-independent protein translocase protein TatB
MPGPMELLIIGALALIVFGPHRLPELARSLGKAVNEFRRQASDLKSEFTLDLDEEDDEDPAYHEPPEGSGEVSEEEPTEELEREAVAAPEPGSDRDGNETA